MQQSLPQDGDLHVLRVRRRTDPEQPEHPAHQHEPDTADHTRGSCQASIRPAQRRDPRVAPFRPVFELHCPQLAERLEVEAHSTGSGPVGPQNVGGAHSGPRQGAKNTDPT